MSRSLFQSECVRYLARVYLPRLETALAGLLPADVWWQPHAETTSIGKLLRHLDGNVCQWIVSGLGGAPDRRQRALEFEASDAPGGELIAALRATVDEAAQVIEGLDQARMAGEVTIQGFAMTVEEALFHVVEHFSWHTGQIVWIAKFRRGAGHGISYYDEQQINQAKNPAP